MPGDLALALETANLVKSPYVGLNHELGLDHETWSVVNQMFGYDWAIELNETFKELILNRGHTPLIDYQKLGTAVQYTIPTPDHYYLLIYKLGLQNSRDHATFFNDKAVIGPLTTTSVRLG